MGLGQGYGINNCLFIFNRSECLRARLLPSAIGDIAGQRWQWVSGSRVSTRDPLTHDHVENSTEYSSKAF